MNCRRSYAGPARGIRRSRTGGGGRGRPAGTGRRELICSGGIAIRSALAGVLLAAASAPAAPPARAAPKLKTYQTKYYVIHSDLDLETVREAAARLTAMAEEYHRRTKGFSGAIRKRLPFYLFADAGDYHAAGGVPGSSGVFGGGRLMAVVPRERRRGLWKTVQHEGFHQFAASVISRKLPPWVNEGLAEYFGHAIWTGDNYVTGLIPPQRLRRLKKTINSKRLRPFVDMITMTQAEWNARLEPRNYDQAWSMVHFLVHGDGGKYQKSFAQFINDVARGRPWRLAFIRRFGREVDDFQQRYGRWWTSLGENPTVERYTLATVQTLTSYLARAFAQRQRFDDAGAFFEAARAGELKVSAGRWLPPRLLDEALKQAQGLGRWSLDTARSRPGLVLVGQDGVIFTGRFVLRGAEAAAVSVTVLAPAGASSRPSGSRPSGG